MQRRALLRGDNAPSRHERINLKAQITDRDYFQNSFETASFQKSCDEQRESRAGG
jgi:hypothetical protein